MCGIHGFAWKDTGGQADAMVAAARHRGPDGSGTWGDDRVTLGHNLLAVTADPEPARQPWHHGNCVLVFNGEVYNHADLRKSLSHQCRTSSDTEVLAAGLHEQGVDFLRRVDGMYALAWYDPAAATLTLARDTNGARPLYAGFLNDRPVFSSEIRSLLALGFPRRVCRDAFRHYYHAGLVAGPLTMFEGIHRLVPGQVVTFNLATRNVEDDNLNDRPPPEFTGNRREIPGLLRTKLRQAVQLCWPEGRQAGLFLSGGMDSGAILYALARESDLRPRTFSTRFDLPHDRCPHNDDADVAAMLARMYKTTHREVRVGEQRWVDCLEKAVVAMEEPRQGKSYAAYYACNKLLKDSGVVVTLSGDGGDELLMGYKHQHTTPFSTRLGSLRSGNREPGNPALRMTLDEQVAYLESWLPKGGLTGDPANDFMYTECLHTLSEDFLVRNDKLGAAFGMEARFPMMCKVFRDFCRSIPGNVKADKYLHTGAWDVNNKSLLRQAYTGRLPLSVTAKGKTGWRAPTDDWIVGITTRPATDGPVRQYVRHLLKDKTVRDLFEITGDTVENRYLNNRDLVGPPKASGKPGKGVGMTSQKELFSVIMFAAWFKAFDMELW